MYFLTNTPPPTPVGVTTFAGALTHHVDRNWRPLCDQRSHNVYYHITALGLAISDIFLKNPILTYKEKLATQPSGHIFQSIKKFRTI